MVSLNWERTIHYLLEDPSLKSLRGMIFYFLLLLYFSPVLILLGGVIRTKIERKGQISILWSTVILTAFFLYVPIESPKSKPTDIFALVCIGVAILPESTAPMNRQLHAFKAAENYREKLRIAGPPVAVYMLATSVYEAVWPHMVAFFTSQRFIFAVLCATSLILYIPVSAAAHALPSTIKFCSVDKMTPLSQILRIAPLFLVMLRFVDVGLHGLPQQTKLAILASAPLYGSIPILLARCNATRAITPDASEAEGQTDFANESKKIAVV